MPTTSWWLRAPSQRDHRAERAAEAGEIVVGAVALALPRNAAERPRGPGHVLRWRSSPISPPEPRAQPTVDMRTLERHVPVGLRQVLSLGPDPEHRTATVVLVRFSGIDRLIAEAGPPATAEVIDALITVVQQAAEREGVTILATDVGTPTVGRSSSSPGRRRPTSTTRVGCPLPADGRGRPDRALASGRRQPRPCVRR